MKVTYIFIILTLSFRVCVGQSDAIPECIEKLIAEKKYNYKDILVLPTGEKVHKLTIASKKNCKDCMTGTVYKDSLCNTVASFTIGTAVRPFVKEGYESSWFSQKAFPVIKKNSDFQTFSKYIVKNVNDKKNPLVLKKNDVIEISPQNGLLVYRNGKRHNQYKLIPETQDFKLQLNCKVPPCPAVKKQTSYLRWDNWGILLNQHDEMMLYDFTSYSQNNDSDWQILYKIQKLE